MLKHSPDLGYPSDRYPSEVFDPKKERPVLPHQEITWYISQKSVPVIKSEQETKPTT